jgi:Cysteine-rich CPXCG
VIDLSGDEPEDEEFPLGDGTVDTDAAVQCPYCGVINDIAIDAGGGPVQDYVQDCEVCCRPWRVRVTVDPDGGAEVTAETLE